MPLDLVIVEMHLIKELTLKLGPSLFISSFPPPINLSRNTLFWGLLSHVNRIPQIIKTRILQLTKAIWTPSTPPRIPICKQKQLRTLLRWMFMLFFWLVKILWFWIKVGNQTNEHIISEKQTYEPTRTHLCSEFKQP
jgi:hypothetical protein